MGRLIASVRSITISFFCVHQRGIFFLYPSNSDEYFKTQFVLFIKRNDRLNPFKLVTGNLNSFTFFFFFLMSFHSLASAFYLTLSLLLPLCANLYKSNQLNCVILINLHKINYVITSIIVPVHIYYKCVYCTSHLGSSRIDANRIGSILVFILQK